MAAPRSNLGYYKEAASLNANQLVINLIRYDPEMTQSFLFKAQTIASVGFESGTVSFRVDLLSHCATLPKVTGEKGSGRRCWKLMSQELLERKRFKVDSTSDCRGEKGYRLRCVGNCQGILLENIM